jgi:hypothetical protein
MIPFVVSLLMVVLVWYVLRLILQSHPPTLLRLVDLAAAVLVVLLVLRYFALL